MCNNFSDFDFALYDDLEKKTILDDSRALKQNLRFLKNATLSKKLKRDCRRKIAILNAIEKNFYK